MAQCAESLELPPCPADWKAIMQTNCHGLLSDLDVEESGLYGELINIRYATEFNQLTLKRIWGELDKIKLVDKLLEHIQRGPPRRFQFFCLALSATGQDSIVDRYLTRKNVDRTDSVPYVILATPLSVDSKFKLTSNWNYLIDTTSSDAEFLVGLGERKVLTELEVKRLKNVVLSAERNESLIRILECRSEECFVQFCELLIASNQSQIVTMMNASTHRQAGEPADNSRSGAGERQTGQPPAGSGSSTQLTCSGTSGGSVRPESGCYSVETGLKGVERAGVSYQESTQNSAPPTCHSPVQVGVTQDMNQLTIGTRSTAAAGAAAAAPLVNGVSVCQRPTRDMVARVQKEILNDEILAVCQQECSALPAVVSLIAICVLSHGSNGSVYGTDGKPVSISDITTCFDGSQCSLLIGRPKLFFIQACQGDRRTQGVGDVTDADGELCENAAELLFGVLPTPASTPSRQMQHEKADMAIVLATHPGYAAWRNEVFGSYFIESLTRVFIARAHEKHFMDMTQEVIRDMNSRVIARSHKQVCQITSTLAKFIYLLPY